MVVIATKTRTAPSQSNFLRSSTLSPTPRKKNKVPAIAAMQKGILKRKIHLQDDISSKAPADMVPNIIPSVPIPVITPKARPLISLGNIEVTKAGAIAANEALPRACSTLKPITALMVGDKLIATIAAV